MDTLHAMVFCDQRYGCEASSRNDILAIKNGSNRKAKQKSKRQMMNEKEIKGQSKQLLGD